MSKYECQSIRSKIQIIFDLDFDGDVDNSDIIAIVFPSTDSSMSTAYNIAVAQLVLFVAVVFYPNHKLEQLVGGQVTGLVNGGYALLGYWVYLVFVGENIFKLTFPFCS